MMVRHRSLLQFFRLAAVAVVAILETQAGKSGGSGGGERSCASRNGWVWKFTV
jgi:hypothetical protein